MGAIIILYRITVGINKRMKIQKTLIKNGNKAPSITTIFLKSPQV
jgi:hypothetical protein